MGGTLFLPMIIISRRSYRLTRDLFEKKEEEKKGTSDGNFNINAIRLTILL